MAAMLQVLNELRKGLPIRSQCLRGRTGHSRAPAHRTRCWLAAGETGEWFFFGFHSCNNIQSIRAQLTESKRVSKLGDGARGKRPGAKITGPHTAFCGEFGRTNVKGNGAIAPHSRTAGSFACDASARRPRRRRSPPAHTWPRQRKARPTASRSHRGSRRLSLRRIANEQLSKRGSTDESTGHMGHARGEGEGNIGNKASSTEAGSEGSTPRAKASSSSSASTSRTSSTAAIRPSPEFMSFEMSFLALSRVALSKFDADVSSFRDSLAACFRTTPLTGKNSFSKADISRSQSSFSREFEINESSLLLSVVRESKGIRSSRSVSSTTSSRSHTVSD